MRGVITEFTKNSISFLEDGVEELQVFELGEYVKPEYFRVGRASLTAKDNEVIFVTMENGKKESEKKTTAKDTAKSEGKDPHIVNIGGKDFMTYEGLLKKAHEKKECFSMVITESWVSEDMKRAWCKVRLTAGIDGSVTNLRTFDGFGSSTPDNTGKMTQSHPVEMSHTRAKGRALRDYLNIGQVMVEELKDGK